ncbi:MAG: hypothetical protein AB8B91_00775 [Rubripirellula sp.]
MHKREKNKGKSAEAGTKKVVVPEDQITVVSPARDRKSEAIVQRVTEGLMRRDSRRRVRVFFRRIFFWAVTAGVLYGAWRLREHWLPMDLLNNWWADIESKLVPVLFPEE